ncbi:sensor histidine kinase [uncultured Friedmanniella sp.]|uniref:sensor histidine kinase n=1 Tax=uncultured Friedmanniella sp. TaxID=335381 RepID=UPI0035CB4D45
MSWWRPRVRGRRSGARRELVLIVGFAVATMAIVGVGAAFATRSVAQHQALNEAERSTKRLASNVVGPLLAGYRSGDSTDRADLERAVGQRMSDGSLTEVTVWREDGYIVFCSDPAAIGKTVDPPPEVAEALRGHVSKGFEDGEPEADEPATGVTETIDSPAADPGASPSSSDPSGRNRYVEVYVPFDVAGEEPLVFEAYYTYERVDLVADELLRSTLPLVLGTLLLLQLIQIPVAVSLAGRLKRHEQDRARLLERALTVSDRERVRFAADLHDGPIQDLAGIAYALGAVAPSVPPQHVALMGRVEGALQRSIASLRSLMTDLYPPDLRSGTLQQTVRTLVEPLQEAGVAVQLELADVPLLDPESTATLYRVARETLSNVQQHAAATHLLVQLSVLGAAAGHPTDVRLVVQDDGVGLENHQLDRRHEGHLGVRLLMDKVESLGGELLITSAPGQGTRMQVTLPLEPNGVG